MCYPGQVRPTNIRINKLKITNNVKKYKKKERYGKEIRNKENEEDKDNNHTCYLHCSIRLTRVKILPIVILTEALIDFNFHYHLNE